ncbi:MAG: branched-chain amino acid ABC transporter permease [Actinomycetota bacterium]|nr:branched-chain amino acid ABC transporter permease [Actinomycetota bacterium]
MASELGTMEQPAPAPPEQGGRRRLSELVRLPRQPLLRHGLLTVAGGVLCYALSISVGSLTNANIATVAVYTVVIAGLSLLVGGTGQVSLGHAALMAIGAYSYADLEVHNPHVPLVAGLLFATALTGVAGLVIGVAAARLRGPYLAGVTLALGLAVPQLADHYFNSDQGIPVQLTPPSSIEINHWLDWICLLSALVVLFLLANLRSSRWYRAFAAVREDEIAASLSGISVARAQVLGFVLSAACAGLGGALLALVNLGATSGAFPISLSISLIAGMVVGGTGTLIGAVWGGILVVYVPLWLSSATSNQTNFGANLPNMIFGALIVLVVLLAPQGIQGGLNRLAARARRVLRW